VHEGPESSTRWRIVPMGAGHAERVLEIYRAGLETGQASFETAPPTWEAFDRARLPDHRFVALDAASGAVVGWVAVGRVSERPVYAGVVEHAVYVAPEVRGQGVGSALLRALIDSTEAAGVWTIQSSFFPENAVSLRLHRRAGFRVVGRRDRIGRHLGRWRDSILLERRSPVIE
jgi:L-amino acid N-acyltransferase YncA